MMLTTGSVNRCGTSFVTFFIDFFCLRELVLLNLSVLPKMLILALMFLVNYKVESVLRHGSVLLTWSSFLLDKYFQNVDTALFELKHVVKKVWY